MDIQGSFADMWGSFADIQVFFADNQNSVALISESFMDI